MACLPLPHTVWLSWLALPPPVSACLGLAWFHPWLSAQLSCSLQPKHSVFSFLQVLGAPGLFIYFLWGYHHLSYMVGLTLAGVFVFAYLPDMLRAEKTLPTLYPRGEFLQRTRRVFKSLAIFSMFFICSEILFQRDLKGSCSRN